VTEEFVASVNAMPDRVKEMGIVILAASAEKVTCEWTSRKAECASSASRRIAHSAESVTAGITLGAGEWMIEGISA